MRISVAIAVACLSMTGLSAAEEASAVARKFTNIEAQPLATALHALAKERGMQLVYRSEVVGDARTGGAVGELTLEEALTQLLSGTGLTFQYLEDQAITIVPLSAIPSQSRSPGASSIDSSSADPTPSIGQRLHLAQSDPTEGVQHIEGQTSPGEDPQSSLMKPVDEIVVTGTYIRGVLPDSSPVTVYDRKQIDQTGASTVEEFIRTLPQNFASVDSSSVNGTNATGAYNQLGGNSFGGAAVNLRGMGPGATLTLINGRRVSPGGTNGEFVDVSMIPLSAVERVEVLADGASASYGADAVAGVVNFVLKKEFEGAETTVRAGGATRGGDDEITASQLLGTHWRSGNVLMVLEHNDREGLTSTQRDFIPDQGIDAVIIPENRRTSVFVSGRQDMPLGASLSFDLSYGDREFVQDIPGNFGTGVFTQHIEGGNEQTVGALTLGKDLMSDWRAELTTNYSKTDQHSTRTSPGSVFGNEAISSTGGADLRADGSLFPLPGGTARLALGGGYRKEKLRSALVVNGQQLEREVASAYGEIFLPLAGSRNARPWARRLELSVAARYDHYDDAGSSFNPKFGLLWSPVAGFNIRGTYSTSFRAPLLIQMTEEPLFFTFPIQDPSAPDGVTNTLLNQTIGNRSLKPEESESFSAGIDIRPPGVPGLAVSATYFRTRFTGRIASPPLVGSNFLLLYTQETSLEPFIDRTPDPATVQAIFDSPGFAGDFAGAGPEGVEAIFQNTLLNLAYTKESGVELNASYTVRAGGGELGLALSGTYLLQIDYKALRSTPDVELLNKVGEPMDFRLRSALSWSRGGFLSSLALNHSSGYENNVFTPARRVDSWTTADLQLQYGFGETAQSSIIRNVTIALNVRNLTDEDPPSVLFPESAGLVSVGYDPANASPLGRVVSGHVTKRW